MKVTLTDIAVRAGVSRMTVSRVLSQKKGVSLSTSQTIKKIAEEMGYHPNLIARSLSTQKSMTIGIFIPKTKNVLLDIYMSQILSGVIDILEENDYKMMFFPFSYQNLSNENPYLNAISGNLIDGMILLKTRQNDPYLKDLAKSGFPFVLVNHRNSSSSYNFVDSRNVEGARLAVEYLFRLGHRKIAFVEGTMSETNAIDRKTGYLETLKNLGIPLVEEYIINGDFSQSLAYQNCDRLLDLKDRPTGIFCSDDYMAIGVINKIRSRGLSVPEDISVVGFDDIDIISYFRPPITTIKQPIYEIGEKSAEILLSLIQGNTKPPIHEFMDVRLIERSSCARI